MLKTQRMKDNSEIIPYQDPRLPLYVAAGKLSLFYNMTPLCHWHDEMEYIRIERGCMYYYINGEKILMKEGEAVLINSGRCIILPRTVSRTAHIRRFCSAPSCLREAGK